MLCAAPRASRMRQSPGVWLMCCVLLLGVFAGGGAASLGTARPMTQGANAEAAALAAAARPFCTPWNEAAPPKQGSTSSSCEGDSGARGERLKSGQGRRRALLSSVALWRRAPAQWSCAHCQGRAKRGEVVARSRCNAPRHGVSKQTVEAGPLPEKSGRGAGLVPQPDC